MKIGNIFFWKCGLKGQKLNYPEGNYNFPINLKLLAINFRTGNINFSD